MRSNGENRERGQSTPCLFLACGVEARTGTGTGTEVVGGQNLGGTEEKRDRRNLYGYVQLKDCMDSIVGR